MESINEFDFGTLIDSLKNNIFRNLHNATLAIVKNVEKSHFKTLDLVEVSTFPYSKRTGLYNTLCYSMGESNIVKGDIVLISYLDRDFRDNLKTILGGNDTLYSSSDTNLHAIDYGFVIKKIDLPKYLTLDSNLKHANIKLITQNVIEKDSYNDPLISFDAVIQPNEFKTMDEYFAIVDVALNNDVIDLSKIRFASTNPVVITCVGILNNGTRVPLYVDFQTTDGTLKKLQLKIGIYELFNIRIRDVVIIRISNVFNGADLV